MVKIKQIFCLHKNRELTYRCCDYGGLFNLHYDIYEYYKCKKCGKYFRRRVK